MGFLVKALLVLLLAAIAGVTYVVKLAFLYIGSDILNICWRLFRQGMSARQVSDKQRSQVTSHALCQQDPSSLADSPSVLTYQSATSHLWNPSQLGKKCCSLLSLV